jgi:hypothetical protein
MWLKLCSLGNRPVVHVPLPDKLPWAVDSGTLHFSGFSEYWGDGKGPDGLPLFPANAPVMDHDGRIHQGITADNPFPVCMEKPQDPTQLQYADAALKSIAVNGTGAVIPYCPPGFVTQANQLEPVPSTDGTFPDAKRWAARGAINAAMAVFLYLDEIERDPTKRKPLYNQCDQLPAATK